jgi:hypothetical protein
MAVFHSHHSDSPFRMLNWLLTQTGVKFTKSVDFVISDFRNRVDFTDAWVKFWVIYLADVLALTDDDYDKKPIFEKHELLLRSVLTEMARIC